MSRRLHTPRSRRPAPLPDRLPERASTALFCDFDGTLAPIVEDPFAARPAPRVVELLEALAHSLGVVAVVSGRPVAFLTGVLGRPVGVHLVGHYGFEHLEPSAASTVPSAVPELTAWLPKVASATSSLIERAQADGSDVVIEPKVSSVTVHWRSAPAEESWARRIVGEVAGVTGLVEAQGRMAVELRPPLAVDKGTVIRQLGSGYGRLIYIGDDLGDLPAFQALDELAAEDGVETVRVVVDGPETPREVRDFADEFVSGVDGVIDYLENLRSG